MPAFGSRTVDRGNKTIKTNLRHQNMQNKEIGEGQEFKQVYVCPCGKQYMSFPAIYLHYREKHDIRLSTKPTERRKTVQIEGNIKKIIYLHQIQNQEKSQSINQSQNDANDNPSPTQSNSLEISSEIKKIKNCIDKYLSVSNNKSKRLLQKLVKYLGQQNFSPQQQKNITIQQLPMFLNNFSLFYLPKCIDPIQVGSNQWNQSCIELKQFCDWLRNQKYTELIVFYQNVCSTENR